MVECEKHTQTFAAGLSGLNKSAFSRLLSHHPELALMNLEILSQHVSEKILKSVSKSKRKELKKILKGSPWNVAIIIDSTLQTRSSLYIQNAQRFNHGSGWVIGHQWTNVVLLINDIVVPLPPIPFLTKSECKKQKIKYQTEPEKLMAYLSQMKLEKYIGIHDPSEIVVLMDAGYDNKDLQVTIRNIGWDIVCSLKSTRVIKPLWRESSEGKKWINIETLFVHYKKQAPWQTVRTNSDGGKKRKDFRARTLDGFIKGIFDPVILVCSEKTKGVGRRYLLCTANVKIGVIVRTYAKRWLIECFHKEVKSYLGMEDAGVTEFSAQEAHVYWVYCAYILLKIYGDLGGTTIKNEQRQLQKDLDIGKIKNIQQLATRFNGLAAIKYHCSEAILNIEAA